MPGACRCTRVYRCLQAIRCTSKTSLSGASRGAMSRLATHYDNLQVARTAGPDVIKAAYRSLCQKWHPDRNEPANREACEKAMRLINAAYAVLSDPAKRRAHDDWIAEQEARVRRPEPERRDRRLRQPNPDPPDHRHLVVGAASKGTRSVVQRFHERPGAIGTYLLAWR